MHETNLSTESATSDAHGTNLEESNSIVCPLNKYARARASERATRVARPHWQSTIQLNAQQAHQRDTRPHQAQASTRAVNENSVTFYHFKWSRACVWVSARRAHAEETELYEQKKITQLRFGSSIEYTWLQESFAPSTLASVYVCVDESVAVIVRRASHKRLRLACVRNCLRSLRMKLITVPAPLPLPCAVLFFYFMSGRARWPSQVDSYQFQYARA